MQKEQNQYYLDRVFTFPNAVANVYRPIITEDERARRMRRVESSAAELIKELLKMEGEKING